MSVPQKDTINLVILAFISLGILTFSWVGFGASDDWNYLVAAQGWLDGFPFVGTHHHSVRHTLVLPIALVIGLFGSSEFNTVVPTTAFFFGTLVLSYHMFREYFGQAAGLICTALLVTTPLFAVLATMAGVDIVELFFVVLSLWLFFKATESNSPSRLLFASGLAAGFALLTRETAVALLVFYTLLFLYGSYFPRKCYFAAAAGVMFIEGAEMLYFALLAGDPLHRLTIALSQGARINPTAAGTGNVLDHRIFGPPLALLINQEFGILYFLALPAGWFVCFSSALTARQRSVARFLVGLGVIWFVFIGYIAGIRPLPRYFPVTTFAAVAIVGIWITQVLPKTSRLLTVVLGAGLVSTNLLGIAVENRDPLFGERALVRYIVNGDGPVFTNPETAFRAEQLLIWEGVDKANRLRTDPPPAGSLYFYYSKGVLKGSSGRRRFDLNNYSPQLSWSEIWREEAPASVAAKVASSLHLGRILPETIAKKLLAPNPPVIVYRVN